MGFSGELGGIRLPDVFQNIESNQASGVLLVEGRGGPCHVWFRDGKVAGVSSGEGKALPIRAFLADRGLVDAGELHKLESRTKRSRKSLCRRLAEAGLLDEQDFVQAVATAIAERVYDLMRLDKARFAFDEGEAPERLFDPEQRAAGVRLAVGPLMMESARRQDDWERIRKVVTGDADLFVLLEGWDELEDLDEVTEQVAAMLDGRTCVADLVRRLPYSRYEVLKGVTELVLQNVARPCSVGEIEDMVAQALEDGHDEEAIALLTRALDLEKGNDELRHRLCELLEHLGRAGEAATELARLGYDARRAGRVDDALALYGRAVDLAPDELALRERRHELLLEHGGEDQVADSAVELARRLLDSGLPEQARGVLEGALEQLSLAAHPEIGEQQVEVALALGQPESAAATLLRIAERCTDGEPGVVLPYLHRAAELDPEDRALQRRIADLESGEHQRRRERRRSMTTRAIAGVVLVGSAMVGIAELVAARHLNDALTASLESIADDRPATAVEALQRIHESWSWTPTGRRAAELAARLDELQCTRVEQLLGSWQQERAAQLVRGLAARRGDRPAELTRRYRALAARAEAELAAKRLLQRASRLPFPDDEAIDALARLHDPELLDFLLGALDRVHSPMVRVAVLEALRGIDDPRRFAPVAMLYLLDGHMHTTSVAEKLLAEAPAARAAHGDHRWSALYPLLEQAGLQQEGLEQAGTDPERAARAAKLLHLLRGDELPSAAAGPRPQGR